MPLFLSDEEFRLLSGDAAAVAERADSAIRDLRRQVDTVRAEADAASIAAEQTCALLEQRYENLSSEFDRIRSENSQLSASVEQRLSELAEAQAEKHQLHLKAIAKDGEIERLSLEITELNKSKRQMLDLVEQKDSEIREKNATIQSYLDKIVNITDKAVEKEVRLQDIESELMRLRASCSRISQEKELLEKHNMWLNEELTAKVKELIESRKQFMDVEADMSAKLADREAQINDSSNLLRRSSNRVAELELRVDSLEKELLSSKDAAAANEERLTAELSTVAKLAELYKERSEELSKKAGELEGVIKALETHLSQVENEYKGKLDNEVSIRKNLEKDASELKEKLEKYEAEVENTRKANELSLVSFPSISANSDWENLSIGETISDHTFSSKQMLIPKLPAGVCGTALAASLLRDGWSLAKMYEKYQETADAWRHEKWGRKNAEAVLERVLHEIEEKAEIILDERAEHERMMEAYASMNEKVQQALLEHDNFENSIRNLKADLKKRERDMMIAQKEIIDLQKQVTILLKECQDVQVRCGATQVYADGSLDYMSKASSEDLMSFKDISGLVEQNVDLRHLVHRLTCEDEKKEEELKEAFQIQLQKVTDEAAAKVEAVLKRCEEQGSMLESLHSAVAMYKRLYEEERKVSASSQVREEILPDGKKELMLLFEGSQEVSKKAYEQLAARAKSFEEDLAKLRSELISLRSERDKRMLEANFARDQLDSLKKEVEHQRKEANAVSARNIELTQLVVDFQKKLRESGDSLQASEERSRKLSMEVSILKYENGILVSSEKKATDEICSLSERVHRLQSSLDTMQSTEEVREGARAMERRKHEEYLQKVEREWAEVKKELQEERDRVRALTQEKEKAIKDSMSQVEDMRKEFADAWSSVASAESRAAVAEARCFDLERKFNRTEKKVLGSDGKYETSMTALNASSEELWKVKEEMDRLKDEAQANKTYMLQYKEIAHTNEAALKQIESDHENYKAEAERLKEALETDVRSLRMRVSELERNYVLKCEENISATEAKEKELSAVLAESSSLREEIIQKKAQIESLEGIVSSLKEDLDREHQRWRTTKENYERQVILQSQTIEELTNTSKELSILQSELTKLRDISDAQKTENDILKATLEKEKMTRQASKVEAETKYNEVNEQNKILHSRLETLHIRLADKEHGTFGVSSQQADSHAESGLQNVISYLRRSKEIAETEITLLKQEKARLAAQLDSALKASETAQTLLHSRREDSRAVLLKDEEFKSLQLQVREINLLRESNMQLREENKHNFEESRKYRDEAQKAKMVSENFENLLKEKQLELDACEKEVGMLKLEIGHLNNRISELVESRKNFDPAEYERMKDELQQMKALLKDTQVETELARNIATEKQEIISNLEQTLAKYQVELEEHKKKLSDALQVEESSKLDSEKQKRVLSILKKKNDALTKDKDELTKEIQGLMKQIEDLKSNRKTFGETAAAEQATREKDTRIQILEKTLERERDDLRKEREDNKREKQRRLKTENTILDIWESVKKDKEVFKEELAKHRQVVLESLKSSGLTASQLPSESILNEYYATFLQSAEKLEVASGSFADDGSRSHTPPPDSLIMDVPMPSAGQQVLPMQQTKHSAPLHKVGEERDKEATMAKPKTEVRKTVRRLVRPPLVVTEEPQVEVEPSGAGRSTTEGKSIASHAEVPAEVFVDQPSSSTRKRVASSSTLEQEDEVAGQDEVGVDAAPPLKKSKDSDFFHEGSETQTTQETADSVDGTQPAVPSTIASDVQAPFEDMEADQGSIMQNDMIIDAPEEDDPAIKEDPDEQQKSSLDDSHENEAHVEGDLIVEDMLDKSKVDLLDESLRNDDEKEKPPMPVAEEDEKEEGELMSDENEEQQGRDSTAESQLESVPSDGGGARDETGDAAETAAPEVSSEKVEINALEDTSTAGDSKDQVAVDTPQNFQTSGVRESSPASQFQASPSRQRNQSSGTEAEESRASQTITISERAKQNAALRQARLASQPPARGRARGGFRRDTRGGAPRGRGGRGN